MKRNFVIATLVVLVGVIGWAGATYFVGCKIKKDLTALVEEHGNWPFLKISMQNYQQGFLSSTAQTVVELKLPAGQKEDRGELPESVRVVLNHAISHGPLSPAAGFAFARIETRIASVSPGEEQFQQLLERFPQLQQPLLVNKVTYTRAVESHMDIQAIETQIDGAHLNWGGFTAESTFSPWGKTQSGSFQLRALTLNAPDAEFVWDGATGRFDLAEALPLLYVGQNAITFNALRCKWSDAADATPQSIEMKECALSTSSSYDDKLVQAEQILKFTGLTLNGQTYGPGDLEIEMRNLDGEALSTYQQQLFEILGASDTIPSDQLLLRFLPVYAQLFTKMAEGNPQLNIRRLHLVTPQGDIDGNLHLSFNGGKGVQLNDPAVLMQRIEASAELTMHECLVRELALDSAAGQLQSAREAAGEPRLSAVQLSIQAGQQANAQIEAFLAQKLAVRDGDRLKTTASFHKGELTVNGQPLPLF